MLERFLALHVRHEIYNLEYHKEPTQVPPYIHLYCDDHLASSVHLVLQLANVDIRVDKIFNQQAWCFGTFNLKYNNGYYIEVPSSISILISLISDFIRALYLSHKDTAL